MNVIKKNSEGKMSETITYIGEDDKDFLRVGNTEQLDMPGTIFSYARYQRIIEANIDMYIEAYYRNAGHELIRDYRRLKEPKMPFEGKRLSYDGDYNYGSLARILYALMFALADLRLSSKNLASSAVLESSISLISCLISDLS